MHFFNRINCNSGLEPADITTLNAEDVKFMRQYYLENAQMLALTEGLGTVMISKLISYDWTNFKSTVIERHGRSIGCMCIPLLYVTHESNEYDFDDNFAYLYDKLVNCTQLRGPAYQANNGNVLSIFVQHTKNTEGTSMVKSKQQRRYGHKAW